MNISAVEREALLQHLSGTDDARLRDFLERVEMDPGVLIEHPAGCCSGGCRTGILLSLREEVEKLPGWFPADSGGMLPGGEYVGRSHVLLLLGGFGAWEPERHSDATTDGPLESESGETA